MRMLLDGISAVRFLFQGAVKDFWAVFRAHVAFYRIKNTYGGSTHQNNLQKNDVIVSGIYPGSIVADFFIRGKKRFGQLNLQFMKELDKQ